MNFEDSKRRGTPNRRKSNECTMLLATISVGILFGFFIGASFPAFSPSKIKLISPIDTYLSDKNSGHSTQTILNVISVTKDNLSKEARKLDDPSKIWVPSNPRGAERLPPAIVASESDLFPRRLFGKPSEDLTIKPKYLVTFTVGEKQKPHIDSVVKKFSENFTILLFHYDGKTTEWDEFEWSKRAIHISVAKQTKWWYAKRFLHPDIIAPYDYIFIWDEDLGVEHFDSEEYIKLVRKHGLEISQPGLDHSSRGLTWQMTKRRGDREVHKETEEKPGWCSDPHLPSCAGLCLTKMEIGMFAELGWHPLLGSAHAVLQGGAMKLVLSSLSADAPMFVVQVNETAYKPSKDIVCDVATALAAHRFRFKVFYKF